ncbi:thiaminase II [Klebsiella michiganensis]|uniref:Thiaminase II n=1 Tax=Klebsiella michiganensis TaxID=1134687 RepID=A0A7H4MZA5_9ENTR|nr:thiaminase II [Klebsiella michiganensis]
MQQHRFVTDIEQDRLPTAVFNRYLAFEGNFVATGNRDFCSRG